MKRLRTDPRAPSGYRRAPLLDEEAEWGEARTRRDSAAALGLLVGTTVAVAGFGTAMRVEAQQWYAGLDKPSFTPPPIAFPIVWTGIYTLWALSGWLVWSAPKSRRRRRALRWWGVSLALNAAWSTTFFGMRRPGAALLQLAALTLATRAYTKAARTVDRSAARLTLPYLGWLAFTATVHEEIWRNNR